MTKLPPGPGNVVLATLEYLRDPYRHLLDNHRKYGEPYRLPSFLGTMVVTGDPAGAKTLLTADPDKYLAIGADLLGPVLGESNLILLSGERHRAMRKLQTPPFQGARMRAYGQLILRVADEHISRWPADGSFSVHHTMQEISLEVILQAVFGLDDPERRQVFKQAVLELVGALKPSFMFFKSLRRSLGGMSAWARFRRRSERVTALFNDELRRRREDPRPREDILSLLMAARFDDGQGLPDEDLLTQMMNLIGAGHETTASSLAWALHHLHRNPEPLQRLVAELQGLPPGPLDPELVTTLPYLDAVCSEAMRLEPVAPLIGRKLRQPLSLQGYEVPAGMAVAISILGLHRQPDIYPQPDRFVPERFIERSYSPFEYLPFGGGARRCLGAAFAVYEMKLVLASVLRRFRLAPVETNPVRAVVRNTTAGPAGGVPMRLQ